MGPEQALRNTLFRDSNMNAHDIMKKKGGKEKEEETGKNFGARKARLRCGARFVAYPGLGGGLPWSQCRVERDAFRACLGVFQCCANFK